MVLDLTQDAEATTEEQTNGVSAKETRIERKYTNRKDARNHHSDRV